MSTLLDDFSATTEENGHRLREATAAARVSFHWFGTRKSLSSDQKAEAADTFGAEEKFLSAGKKLLDTAHPAWKQIASLKTDILGYWRSVSLPFPESGIRLIRQDQIEPFNQRMVDIREQLAEAVWRLNEHYAELKLAAQRRLGRLFNSADYPASLDGMFQVEWDFPSVEPPEYMMRLNPELYRQECERIRQRFDEAVRLAEEAFTGELSKLVSHLTERLSGSEDGKPKIFRDSAVANLNEFFDRFRQLNICTSDQLDQLVSTARQVLRGVSPGELRNNDQLRQHVATELTRVQSTLDGLLVDRPRRNILRKPR